MSFPMCMLSWKSKNPDGCCSMKCMRTSSARRASSGLVEAAAEDAEGAGASSRLVSMAKMCAGNGGGRIVSAGATV